MQCEQPPGAARKSPRTTLPILEFRCSVTVSFLASAEGRGIYTQTESGSRSPLPGKPPWVSRCRRGRPCSLHPPVATGGPETESSWPALSAVPCGGQWWAPGRGCGWPSQWLTGTRSAPSAADPRDCPGSWWPGPRGWLAELGHKKNQKERKCLVGGPSDGSVSALWQERPEIALDRLRFVAGRFGKVNSPYQLGTTKLEKKKHTWYNVPW